MRRLFSFTLIFIILFACNPNVGKKHKQEAHLTDTEGAVDTLLGNTTATMERLHFEILINAEPQVVYDAIIDSNHFKRWASVFSPTSHFEGTWEEGSKMYFLAIDEDGNKTGMLSTVKKNTPHQFISLEHFGMVQKGKEITEGEDIAPLVGSLENYTISKEKTFTRLEVDSDSFSEFKDFFVENWPKALSEIKDICENR